MTMRAALLITVAVVALCAAAQAQPDGIPKPARPACASISANDAQLEPLTRLCEFALNYNRSLPDFFCQRRAVSRASWMGGPPPATMEAQVTYRAGQEEFSNVTVNGHPGEPDPHYAALRTKGEFGNELVDLFAMSPGVEFRFVKRTSIRHIDAIEFSFHLPREKNQLWGISDARGPILPEFDGSVWVEEKSAKLLRMSVKANHLPLDFQMETMERQTEYGDVSLGEAGVHLLPVSGQSRACFRTQQRGAQVPVPRCITNKLEFSGCRKFAAKARIVP